MAGLRAFAAAATLLVLSVPALAAPLQPCRVAGIANEVQCGVVQRPLDPARPNGTRIDVHYVVVPALARRKLPDPVFLLAGGPGQSAVTLAANVLPLFGRLNNRRDIVFVDQRGTGRSAPLECADERAASLADQGGADAQVAQMQRCRQQLRKLPYAVAPADLGFFTTVLASQDMDAVRAQLGAERVNVVGASYGTRAALDYLRQFPGHVRRSVLDGVAPPDMALPLSASADAQAALDALFAACAAEAACAAAHPNLRARWQALLASLPRPVTATHPLTGARESFVLDREQLLAAVRGPLYAPWLAAALPAAIDAAAPAVPAAPDFGAAASAATSAASAAAPPRFEPLLALGAALVPRHAGALAMGMHFSVVCSEDMPADADAGGNANAAPAAAPGADFGRSVERLYRRVCADWPRGAVPAAFYQVPASASPVLLFSGGLDPATPPRHAERVARALGANARQVAVSNAGHGLLGVGCTRDVVTRFIDAIDDRDALAVDASCLAALPRPPAFAPPFVAPYAPSPAASAAPR